MIDLHWNGPQSVLEVACIRISELYWSWALSTCGWHLKWVLLIWQFGNHGSYKALQKKALSSRKISVPHTLPHPIPRPLATHTHSLFSVPQVWEPPGKLPLNYTKSVVFLKNDSWEHSSQIKFLECCPSWGASHFTEHVQCPTINTRFFSFVASWDYFARMQAYVLSSCNCLPCLVAQSIGVHILDSTI